MQVSDSEKKRVGIYVDEDLHRRAKAKLSAEGSDFQKLLVPHLRAYVDGTPSPTAPTEPKGVPKHRQPLVKAFLTWWDGKREPVDQTVKLAVAKLAQAEWVIPEIEGQSKK